jgi:hypothetical protein
LQESSEMAIGQTEDRMNPWDPVAFEVTQNVWVPIRGFHLGQQSTRLHQQAGHMTASDQIGTALHKHLANRGPSTHGSRLKVEMTGEKWS